MKITTRHVADAVNRATLDAAHETSDRWRHPRCALDLAGAVKRDAYSATYTSDALDAACDLEPTP